MTTPRISVVLPLLCPTPFLQEMAAFSISALRLHADNPFELVIAEAGYDTFDPNKNNFKHQADTYLNFTNRIGAIKECNAGFRAASGQFIVATGSDVIVPPHWDTHLFRCFSERQDCGLASLSAFEPGAIIGPPAAVDRIVEGFYSPFMAWRKGWDWCEDYLKIYQDSDLVMRMYEGGLRAYRSCRAHVHHLLRMTSDSVEPDRHQFELARDERLFYSRWGDSPLSAYAMIRYGQYTYGQEYRSFLDKINLHYDPDQPV